MKKLKNSYMKVQTDQGIAYGGNQAWFPYKFLQKTGCGVISAADVLCYLDGRSELSEMEYVDFAKHLWKYYLPVIPGFGMNGLTLMIGLNRYFIKNHKKERACWKFSAGKMVTRIDKMLANDCPVILSVGPNFPKFWGKESLTFYKKDSVGNYIPAAKIRAHFVTVTERDGVYLKISSWGKEFYINIREYRAYVKRYSSPLISNIIYIK